MPDIHILQFTYLNFVTSLETRFRVVSILRTVSLTKTKIGLKNCTIFVSESDSRLIVRPCISGYGSGIADIYFYILFSLAKLLYNVQYIYYVQDILANVHSVPIHTIDRTARCLDMYNIKSEFTINSSFLDTA